MATPRFMNVRVIGIGLLTALCRSTTAAQPPNGVPDITSWEIFDSDAEYRIREDFLRFARSKLDKAGLRSDVESLARILASDSSPLPALASISEAMDGLASRSAASETLGIENSTTRYDIVKIGDSIKETRPSFHVEPPRVMLIHDSLELYYEPDLATFGIRSNSKPLMHTFGNVFQPIPGSTFGIDWLRSATWSIAPDNPQKRLVSERRDSPVIFEATVDPQWANLPRRFARLHLGEVVVVGRYDYGRDEARGLVFPKTCIAAQFDRHNFTFMRYEVETPNWSVDRERLKIDIRGILPLVDFRGREPLPLGLNPAEWPIEVRKLVSERPPWSGPVAEALIAVRDKLGVPVKRQ